MPSPIYSQFNNQNGLVGMIQQFKQNPMAMLARRYNIPQNISNPNEILQYLLNSHQVSQEQINQVMQLRNDPRLQNLFK